MLRLAGGAETLGWSHMHMWWLRIGNDILAMEATPEISWPHIGVPSLEHQCWEEKSPQHLTMKSVGILSG